MLKETRFLLPRVEHLDISITRTSRTRKLDTLGYLPEIEETKNKISSINNDCWIKLRKLTNPLDYPCSLGMVKPISRAFFKLLEIIKDNNINVSVNSLHLCEAPGGFIQATNRVSRRTEPRGIFTRYTFSLIGSHRTPTYNRTLVAQKNVVVLSNPLNGGNIYSIDNIKYLVSSLKTKKIRFITADGGFSETSDFSNKEQLHHRLIYNQIICALHILEDGGDFVIKMFDIYTELTFDFIYLLCFLFGKVYIHKPNTSRPTNSERYICCLGYDRKRFTPALVRYLRRICEQDVNLISSFISKSKVPLSFVSRLRETSKYFSEYQIYSINGILDIHRLNLKVNQNTNISDQWIKTYFA